MAEIYSNIGQLSPVANVLTQLFANDSVTDQVVVSLVCVCNRNATEQAVRLVHQLTAESPPGSDGQFLYFDFPIPPSDTLEAVKGLTLQPGESLHVQANAAGVDFNAYGAVVSPD